MNPPGPRETRDLLDRYGLRPRSSLGQHFVTDANTVRKIVRVARIAPGDRVIEVGPGLGSLTLALCEAGATVVAIEQDRTLEGPLHETLGGRPVAVTFADAMEADLGALTGGRATKHVSNLPYNVATPLVLRMLEERTEIGEHTFMVQKEVGERLAAAPGAPAFGAVSLKVAYFARASVPMRVSRRAFYPVPGVDSVIVRLERRERPPIEGERAHLFAAIDAGFAQRRKTIRNALSSRWSVPEAEAALAAAGIDARERAERLDLAAFAALALALPRQGAGP